MNVPPEVISLVRQWVEKAEEDLRTAEYTLTLKTLTLGIRESDVAEVNRYAIEGRYPGEWEPITREDAETAVRAARKTREAVWKHFPPAALNG